ncbi:MAG TPA: hypothetical protein DHW15_02505 [Bacteroidetes bacterium]|jgi:hypothetical protein|nr:MAG: hypothetical protein ABR94_10875 [Sphingobacteriales bacterium BACL12 MAG-120802-bin5]KRP10372.1 MAG: hypothetical protein ABR95_12215 [Sphingobacteriales bacterium BACL12 MAG-120813-bin55]HCK21056.1 hypothetical protein [Bacteroidota bacterium]
MDANFENYSIKNILLLLVLGVSLVACQKDSNLPPNNALVGTWRLIEVLQDPGDGSGTFQPVESEKTLTFRADSTVISNGIICDMSINADTPSSGTYTLSDSTISSASCTGQQRIRFQLDGPELTLHYPCFEACIAKFIRE